MSILLLSYFRRIMLRVMPVDNYLVFYIPDKNTRIVTVLRVMYAGRNIDKQLKSHTKL